MSAMWKTVQVFISSTFRDMNAERDHLVKVVFPTLRERLEKHRIHLVDIDLRWGVTTEQADNDMVLDLCLDQIDRCRPFFVGVLGQRYGWVPKELSDPAVKKFGWIQGMTGKSITELEILHGVLNNPAMQGHAVFLFRQSDSLTEVPDDLRRDVYEDEHGEQLASVKESIRMYCAEHEVPLREYSCGWDAASARLTGLEQFGEYVEQELWAAIAREYPRITKEAVPSAPAGTESWLPEEQDYHERFIESRLRVYVGRKLIHERLSAYLEGDSTQPLLLVGGSGTGKSAILGKQWQDWQQLHPDDFLLPHFVGATPSSTNLRLVLRRFCLALRERFGPADCEVPEEPERLPEAFREFLHAVPEGQHAVLVIDAVNQLDEFGRAQDMHWLPTALPPNVKIIVSCIDEPGRTQPALAALRARRTPEMVVEPLTYDERLTIVGTVPSLSAKTLDELQVAMLLDNPATTNALFVLVALEELRGFGSFERLESRIAALPRPAGTALPNRDELPERLAELVRNDERRAERWRTRWKAFADAVSKALPVEDPVIAVFQQVIERLEREISGEIVRRALCLIACSRTGLSEQELADILSGPQSASATPRDCWATMQIMLRQLRPYLLRRGPCVDFYHRSLFKAVSARYLSSPANQQPVHAELATHFRAKSDPTGTSTWQGNDARALTETPFHLLHADQHKALRDLYADVVYVRAMCSTNQVQPTEDGPVEYQGIFPLISNLSEAADYLKQHEGEYALQTAAQAEGIISVLLHRTELIRRSPNAAAQELVNYLQVPSFPRLAKAIRKRSLKHVREGLVLKAMVGDVRSDGSDSGHSSFVTALATGPTETRFLSGGEDGQVGYWDIDNSRPIWLVRAHDLQVTYVALSPDGNQALSASTDGSVLLWDVERAVSRPLFTAGIEGQSRNVWPCVSFCSFLGDGTAVVTRGGLCQRFELESGRTIWQNREVFARAGATCENRVDFSSSSNLLVVGDTHQVVRVSSAETGATLRTVDFRKPVGNVALSEDGRQLVVATGQGLVEAFHTSSGESVGVTSTASPSCLCRAVDGNSFFAYDSNDTLHKIEVGTTLQVQSKSCRSLDAFRESHPRLMACLRDDNTLLFGQESGAVILFDWHQARVLKRWTPAAPILKGSLFPGGKGAFAICGRRIAGQSVSGNAVELLPSSGASKTINRTPHNRGISDVAALGQQLSLTVDHGGTAVVWRGAKPIAVHKLGVDLTCCAGCWDTSLGVCGTDADYAVFVGSGTSVQKRSLPSGSQRQQPGISALAAAGRPMSVCAGFYSGEVCYSSAAGQTWRKNPHSLRATAVVLDRSCRLAATGDVRGRVLLWRCSDGDLLRTLFLHRGEVTGLCFTPDGAVLYSTGSDCRLHAVDPRAGTILATTVLLTPALSVLAEPNGRVWALDANGGIYRFLFQTTRTRRFLSWPFGGHDHDAASRQTCRERDD